MEHSVLRHPSGSHSHRVRAALHSGRCAGPVRGRSRPAGAAASTYEGLGSVAIESCVCNKGFIISQEDGLVHGEGDCVRCPPGTTCDTIGLKIQELPLKAGWWRVSNTSFDIKRCEDHSDDAGSGCVGGPNAQACKDNLAGPLCVLCIDWPLSHTLALLARAHLGRVNTTIVGPSDRDLRVYVHGVRPGRAARCRRRPIRRGLGSCGRR